MIGHSVKVFWPVDEKWYEGKVQEFNEVNGEHKLCYQDGDTEWVKIGEIAGASSSDPSPTDGTGKGVHSKKDTPQSSESRRSSPPRNSQQISPRKQPQHPMYNPNPHMYPHPTMYGHPPPSFPMNGPSPTAGGYGMPYPSPGSFPPPPPHMHGGAPPQHFFPPNPSNPQSENSSPDKSPKISPNKKQPAKTWSKKEDATLLQLVHRMQIPVKWSYVAQNMQGRTGKQCRERYVNHLNPRLKSSDWSPIEDATIFHLYNTTGSQWAKMAKMIPGRTDNGIKNRFHNLRRQLEREDEQRMRLSKAEDFKNQISLNKIRNFPDQLRGKSDECWDVFESIGVLAAQSVIGGSLARNASRFGPFRKAEETGEQCARCGLFAPSTHCGTEICTKTGWCVACTRLPPHLCSNVLRECLCLRKVAMSDEEKEEAEKAVDPVNLE